MWFDKIDQIPEIAKRCGFAIFELPRGSNFAKILPKAVHIRKLDKDPVTGKAATVIKKEQLEEIFPIVDVKHRTNFYLVIEQGEHLNESACNCFLKHLEEPHAQLHYVILVNDANQILATVRSRAQLFRLKSSTQITDAPNDIDPKILALAKEYLACTPAQLPSFAKKLTKDSKTARDKCQQVVDAAIILMYKSYFATGNHKFLTKLDQLLTVQSNIKNGNLKLQLVAHML